MPDLQRPVTVLIVDDHEIMAEALEDFLGEDSAIQVVGVAGSVSQAVKLAQELHPKVVLMDFHLPDGSGADAATRIRALGPHPAIVFLSGDESEDALLAAVEAGASGFLLKSKSKEEVIAAVRQAAEGEMLIPAAVLAGLLGKLKQRARKDALRTRLIEDLTRREREILLLMVEGLNNQAIADRLIISVTTVRSHVQRILEKLDAHSKLEAVALAARYRLVQSA